ncbi:MAG: hypothetical protein RLZZ585_1062 [Bacteroidota bacterium]|jgi:hypothetical protein
MKIPSLAGFFLCLFSEFSAPLYVIHRAIICYFILCQHWLCSAQNQVASFVWRIGLTQEIQKFNSFTHARIQCERNKNLFAVNLGLSIPKVSQQIFAPSLAIDYAHLWEIERISLGPVLGFSVDTHVFGTRFAYVHASAGYRFVIGERCQFFQESTFGPTSESFTYLDQKNQQFTWNYHFKLGLQYALH